MNYTEILKPDEAGNRNWLNLMIFIAHHTR